MKRRIPIIALLLALVTLMTACAMPGDIFKSNQTNSANLQEGNNYNADMENGNNTNATKSRIWPWEDPSITLPPFTGEVTEAGTIKSLKVLALGDSSSKDSMQFLAKLAIEAGIEDIKVAVLYRNAGGTLDYQSNDFVSNTNGYTYYEDLGEGWVSTANAKPQDILQSEKWDYVIVHQNLCLHPDKGTYTKLPTLLSAIHNLLRVGEGENKNPAAKILWMQVWAYEINNRNNLYNHTKYYKNPTTGSYDQMLMYNTAVETIQNFVVTETYIDGVIPVGTAVQNMRESYWSDGLTREAEFLSNTGKVLAALMLFKSLTGYDVNGMELSDSAFDHARPHQGVIKESVNNAYLTPFAVSPSVYHIDD